MRYILLTLLLLAGCSAPTPKFILSPQVFWPQSNQLQQARFAFAVSDERGRPYSLRIQKGSDIQQINASNNISADIQNTMAQALTEQAAILDQNSNTQMTIRITLLQALVDQRSLEHAVTNQVSLTVFVQNDQGTFSKTYSGDSSYTAPFRMDVAAVERELRVLTEQVLGQILQDSSWHQAVRG
ncbi:YajG family lipoprotein [Rheinheimera oceanensis]|uniref:YajG family lipoprotein n=1 Tax=Rheinheimera oceanensis TaxID=2817449 RepID=UPI001BFD983E|nr:YajG family lipoprotein [Rheinheimera oceanensis]